MDGDALPTEWLPLLEGKILSWNCYWNLISAPYRKNPFKPHSAEVPPSPQPPPLSNLDYIDTE